MCAYIYIYIYTQIALSRGSLGSFVRPLRIAR